MANNNINIKLTSEQKIEQLKSGRPVYADSFLDTSEGKHLYDVTDKTLQAFLKTQEVVRVSATELSKLYETGFRSFEEQIKYLEDQRSKINTALQTATEAEKKSLIEDGKKVEESLKSVRKFQDASNRKAPIGTAVHKLLEMAIKKEIDLSNEEAALVAINKRLNLQKGSLPELSAIYNPKDKGQNSFRYAIRAAKSLSSLMSEAQMVGGQAEKARTALVPSNGKIYMISGTSDWDTKGRLGDYKTTSSFDPTHNMIQTAVNAFLKRIETGNLNETIVGQVLHLPLNQWGFQKSSGSIYKVNPYKVNPGTYNEDLGFIMNMIDVMEGKKKREDVKIPGSYSSTARYSTEGQFKGIKYAGEWMSSWLKRDPEIVENMLMNLDQRSKEKFIRSLFSMGDSGYYRTGGTADFLRNKYARSYFSNSSLSQMQKSWEQDQYKDVIAKVIEEKAEQDPGIIYGLIYGNRDYGSISDDFYNWAKKSSTKTGRYLDIVSELGSLGSGQTPTEEEKRWLDQGRSKYQKWQPDVFELAESKDLARLEQAEGEIKELPSQHEVEKATNELVSFLTYYPKILDLVRKYMEQSGISGDVAYEAKMIESFLAKRETEMGYQGGYEKFMSSKEIYDALISPKEEKVKDLQEMVEEARDRAEKENTPENTEALAKLIKELETAQANVRNVTLREIMAVLQEKSSSLEEKEIPERERKTLNKLDYYKKIGYWSMINDIFDKRMSYFNRKGPQFTYSSDIQKLLEQSENIEEFALEEQKKKAAGKLSFPEDEQRQKKELERRFKKHQEELDKAVPSADILTPEQFTVSEILNKIQEEYFGTKVGRTIIDTPQMNKIKNVLIENIINQGESFGDFLSDIKSGEKLSEREMKWMGKLFSSEKFVGFEEEVGNLYDEYSASALGAREAEIDKEAMNRATSDIKKRIQRVAILNQNMSGLEDFFQKEIQERIEKEKEFKEPGDNWWYQIQPDIGGKPKWFKTSQDMSKYIVKTNKSEGDVVSGSLGNNFYTGELIQTSRTRPWATYYEGHDPYSDSFDVMQYDLKADTAQKVESKKEEIADNLSDVISDSINVATNELAENENVSESVAEKIVENVENQDLKKKRSDAAKKGWLTRKNKNNLLSPAAQNIYKNIPTQSAQDGPTHVIIDGTTDGDFTNKKKVAEMWDSEGRLISYITKEINRKTSDKPRATPQLDVIKQIKEDTGKIVDMIASQPPSGGGNSLPPINEPPFGGGTSSDGDGNEEKNSKKSLRAEYIKYLREKYDILIKIDALTHKQEQAEAKKEDITGIKKDVEILQRAEKSIEIEMASDRFSSLEEDAEIKREEFVQKHRRQSKANLLGIGDAEDALKSFEKYATKRMKLESEIEQAQLKASTTVGNEKKAWENVVALKQQSLDKTKETYNILEQQARKRVGDQRVDEITEAVKEQSAILSAQKFAGNRGNRTIFDVIKSDIQRATMRITDFGLAAKVLNTARKEIQQVYQNILKLDEAMTNLRIVTGSNTEQAKSMMNTYNDLAMQLGTTTQAVASSAAEWLRQGYSVSEANELIKSSTYLSRLGFMDMNRSVTALTSVMKGFRIEAADSMDIVDKLTQLDAKYATTAGDIATALSRTSAVAREAGLNLDQTAAALTTMIDVSQQDASSVGNAFRTILARYGNVKATAFTSLVGDSEDIDDANGSINDTEKVLGAIGIKIRSSSSDMRDFDDVMDELADKWVTLTDVEKNAVSTALAGVRQRNIFGIYMENYDTYKQAISEAEKAEGSAARKMQAYNESIAYSINQLSAAWEGFTQKLEASPAVKGVYWILTQGIKNLDHILQWLMPVIATFNADKIVSLVKFLSPLATAIPKAVGKGFKERHGNGFYENMTQKMTAENTNATEELTNAMKDNTAALRGEKPKDDKDETNKGDTGDKISKKQTRSARLKTGIASGIGAGAVRFANKGASAFDNVGIFKGTGDVEVGTGEALAMGVAQGALTGVATAFMGPAGAVLASIVGDALSSLWKKFAHADEIARKERVQQAKDNLEAIKGISSAVTGLIDIRKKGDTSLWDADDWKQANEYVESINKAAKASESFSKAINGGITNIEKMTEAQLADIEAARIKYEAEQTYAAGEQDRYTLMKEISENQKKVNDKNASVAKQAQAAIVSATAQLEEYREALRDSYLQAAFYSSHVSAMSSVDISSATLDRVIMEIAREWAEKGVSGIFSAGGSLTSSARTDIVSFLREQSGYESLFNNKSKDVYEIKNALGLFGGDKALIEELKELAQNQDINKVAARLQELGKLDDKYELSDLNNLIDKINTADTTSIATIAHSLNMTVEQFERANKDGAFDWLTTEDALNGADKFLEKMTNLSSIFADLSKNAALSSENIQKVFSSYRFLLRGENGEMSIENIAKNLGDIFLNGINSQAAQAYIGLKISDAMSDRNLWKAFISDETVMAGLSQADITKLKAAGTYEGAADLVESNETIREKFWKLAAESAGEMDLFKEMRDILVEYQTSTYDTEISNLESIKDALGDVNKQREKELELIKAKEALENASKEKKRIYRAGVGIVYTTDQEAVKSAQDKVDELERQKTQDDIQYQIDVLEQQKSILENVAKNEELEALKGAVDKFFGGVTAGNLIDAIFATNDPEKQAALRAKIATSGAEGAADVLMEKKDVEMYTTQKAYEDALKEYYESYEGKNKMHDVHDSGNLSYKDYVNSQIKAVENLENLRSSAVRAGVSDELLEKAPNRANKGKYIYGNRTAGYFYDADDDGDLDRGDTWSATSNLTSEESFLHGFGKGSITEGNDAYYIMAYKNGRYQVKQKLNQEQTANGFSSVKEIKDILKNGEILVHNRSGYGRKDYGVYKGYDGEIYDLGDGGHINIPAGMEGMDKGYASGTLSYPGGHSLINENGLESIITPQGTITSLPAKSGIVPADLTRNLWALGEVAPNLIARLGGSNLQTNNNNATNDNSINIDKLNATFNTDSGFDGQAFINSLKHEVALTKNNH